MGVPPSSQIQHKKQKEQKGEPQEGKRLRPRGQKINAKIHSGFLIQKPPKTKNVEDIILPGTDANWVPCSPTRALDIKDAERANYARPV